MQRSCFVASVCFLVLAGTASAQDDVYERGKDKPHKSFVAKESAQGVSLKDGTTIPAEKIDDIFYEVLPVDVRISIYRPAFNADKESLDPGKEAKRKANIADALKKYQEAMTKVKEPAAKRHSEYKAAVLLARQGIEDGAALEPAIEALKKYKSKHTDSWQVGAALQLLGRLQLEAKDFAGASETYGELSQANVPEDVKQDAQLQVVMVAIRGGKSAEASKQLDVILKSLPKESKHFAKARVAQAELLVAAKQSDEAMKILRGVVKETNDRTLKAMAYNTLGQCLFEKEDYKGARWEFLWVDVVYNQDKNEHAKSLYYLSKIFEQLGDADKAQECRETLLNDRNFAGTEWRARAAKDNKGS